MVLTDVKFMIGTVLDGRINTEFHYVLKQQQNYLQSLRYLMGKMCLELPLIKTLTPRK